METKSINLWSQIGNKCLSMALKILNDEYELANGGIDDVDQLVGIAIAIDDLNLRWSAHDKPTIQ